MMVDFKKLLLLFSCSMFSTGVTMAEPGKKPLNWKELSAIYKTPQWFVDAKLGIWAHWGPQAYPLRGGGWYARHMYMQDVGKEKWGKDAYPYHNKRFGHPSEFGYKDVLNDWKTPKLDTDFLLKYFKEKLGARYFVALANHHDHFDCWDSSYHPWNSMKVGPKRDIVGEFAASAKKVGLPFGVSSHDDRYLGWWKPAFGADKKGPKKGVPYDGNLTKADGKGKWWEGLDPADLYGLPPKKRTKAWIRKMKENWVRRHNELVTKYDVDFLWFDGYNFPYGKYGRSVCENFYNASLRKDKKINVVVAGKPYGLDKASQKGWVPDFERGVPDEPLGRTFQSTTTVRTWFYKEDVGKIKPRQTARSLVELFADVISKGGNLLLNVELKGDGSLPETLMPIYDEFGKWVILNQEAIYATHPWKTPGDNRPKDRRNRRNMDETDLKEAKQHNGQFNEHTADSPPYPHDEVRFTVKGDKLYIFVLNPKAGAIKLPSLGLHSRYKPGKVQGIRMIGGGNVDFKQSNSSLTLKVPAKRPTKNAAVFEVRGAILPDQEK